MLEVDRFAKRSRSKFGEWRVGAATALTITCEPGPQFGSGSSVIPGEFYSLKPISRTQASVPAKSFAHCRRNENNCTPMGVE